MENVLTITNLKPNIIEFNAGLEGLRDNDMRVRLIIEANGMDLGFDAKRIKDTLWEVTIPPLPMLDRTAYPFRMDVVSEGYFFDPLHGTMNVVGTHEMYITDPKNTNIPPSTIEELPKKHTAKPAGTPDKEEEVTVDKLAPKVLKPEVPNKVASKILKPDDQPEKEIVEPIIKKTDTAISDSMARLRAIASGSAEEKEETAVKAAEVVVDAEKKEAKKEAKKPVAKKKLEVGSANKKEEPKKEEPKKVVEATPVIEKTEAEIKTFEEALEKVSKPIPKKKRAPRKAAPKRKAGTIKKITEDKEFIAKPEDEIALEAKKEEAVKDILSEEEETKKVLTHPIKKGGKVTIH